MRLDCLASFGPIRPDYNSVMKPCMGKRSCKGLFSVLAGVWLGPLGSRPGDLFFWDVDKAQ